MARPSTSAKIWHHTSLRAPPPMNLIGSSRCLLKRSTACSSQRALSATPSKTARTRSSRLADSDRLWKPPRTNRSSTGVRSPYSHGVKITPRLPGGACAAIRSNSA